MRMSCGIRIGRRRFGCVQSPRNVEHCLLEQRQRHFTQHYRPPGA